MPSPYLILAVLLAFGGACYKAYTFGYEKAEGDSALQVEAALSKQKSTLDTYYLKQAKAEIIYRDRVQTIIKSADPTGCADTAIPSGMLGPIRGD